MHTLLYIVVCSEDEQAVVRAVAAEQLKLFYEVEAAIAAQPSSLAKTGAEWHAQQKILAELVRYDVMRVDVCADVWMPDAGRDSRVRVHMCVFNRMLCVSSHVTACCML